MYGLRTIKLEGETVVIVKFSEPYNPNEDVIQTNRLVADIFDESEELIYFINDTRLVRLSFTKVVQTMAAAFRDETTLEAEQIKGIAVGARRMLKFYVDSAKQIQFENIAMFDTAKEAIEYARE